MSLIPENIQEHWCFVSPLLSIRDENEYDLAIERMNVLIDEIGVDEQHPLYELLDTLGAVIYVYEEKHHPIPDRSSIVMSHSFLREHQFEPSNLPDVGSPETVAPILSEQARVCGQAPLTLSNEVI